MKAEDGGKIYELFDLEPSGILDGLGIYDICDRVGQNNPLYYSHSLRLLVFLDHLRLVVPNVSCTLNKCHLIWFCGGGMV